MKNCRDFLDIMHLHKEIINDYPHALKDALVKYFEVSDLPKRVSKKIAFRQFKKDVNLIKISKAFMSMVRGGF